MPVFTIIIGISGNPNQTMAVFQSHVTDVLKTVEEPPVSLSFKYTDRYLASILFRRDAKSEFIANTMAQSLAAEITNRVPLVSRPDLEPMQIKSFTVDYWEVENA
jgi:hypothetical protein